jgi:hypothetical protein
LSRGSGASAASSARSATSSRPKRCLCFLQKRGRVDHSFPLGGDRPNERRLLRDQLLERFAAVPHPRRYLHGTWHHRHALNPLFSLLLLFDVFVRIAQHVIADLFKPVLFKLISVSRPDHHHDRHSASPFCSPCAWPCRHQIWTPFCVQSEFASCRLLRSGQVIFASPLSSFQSG